ncbi:MAG: DUF2194 domain-containing protein [Roseburia sp.]|nr:DUF2194 domain-containing protein [Roseburia sp.]MCM1277909.1 DUF2194 domain-containing protein [Robinsoniella sp.]
MLKISDYAAMMLSFLAMLLFYLIFSGSISVNLGASNSLEPVELPEDFSVIRESNMEEPVYAVLCGNQEESEGTKSIIRMLSDLKKEYAVFSTAEEINNTQAESIEAFVVTADSWEEIGNPKLLFQYVEEAGKKLIFTHVPDGEGYEEYNRTIGILENKGTVQIDGVMLFEGMFLQGDMVYFDELEMDVKDIAIDARCKKLMVEKSRQEKEQKELIPLIWEKRYGEGCFYVANGELLMAESGMGIFTGILGRTEEDFVYPVVNAKASLLDSFPELTNPYEEQVQSMYSRDTYMFLRDIVWPAIVKLGESDTLIFSARLNKPIEKEDEENYKYLADLLKRRGYEIDDSLTEKEVELPYVSFGHERKEEEIFHMQSSISGMGLATHYLDISQVMGRNAGKPEYEWSSYSLELSKLFHDLYKETDWMDVMTVSQALERYKRYLLIEPVIKKEKDQISIETGNFNEQCFYVIRTEKTVLSGEGYEAQEIGEEAYLVRALQEKIVIGLEEKPE